MMTSVLTGTGIVCGGLAIWTGIEQNLLLVRRKTIFLKRLPPEFDGFTILQLSDLHKLELGDCNSRIIQQVRLLQPRLVALTGDLISRDCRDFSRTGIFLRELSAACPHVYACLGNHELDLPPAVWETLRHTLSGAGIRLLDNETVEFFREGASLFLAGTRLKKRLYKQADGSFRNLESYSAAELTADLGKRKGCTVLLAHNPLAAAAYRDWDADLTLCGHVHGGIVRLPGIGGLLSPERRFFPAYSKGLYALDDDCQMYVSGGIGKLRLLNPPEINFLTLSRCE